MAVFSASDLSIAFGDRAILDSVELAIQDGERVGLIGKNGEGKTTLAKIVARQLEPDSGRVTVRAGAEVAFLPQQPTFDGDPTAREVVTSGLAAWSKSHQEYGAVTEALAEGRGDSNVLLARQAALAAEVESLGGWDQSHRVERITQHLGVTSLDQSVARMSGGERRRVDMARVLVSQPALAIFDEPTNHLDIETIEWLEDFLQNEYSGALLLITHDRYVLDRVVTRTLELSRGAIHSYPGGWEAYLTKKAERASLAERTESNRQNILRRELDWLSRSPKARTTKSKSRIKRAEALVADAPAAADRAIGSLAMQKARSGKTAFELANLSLSVKDRVLIDGLDLIVRDGERIGVVGPNGCGKTTLLKALLGKVAPVGGQVKIAQNTRFAFLDQERSDLEDQLSVAENICGNREEVEVGGRTFGVPAYLSRFLFDGDKRRQLVGSLSGGERARVQLAKFLLEPANVLLLDEPTNDLDVTTLAALEDFLLDTGVTVVFVTHDRYFLDRVADAVLVFEEDGQVVRYQGSFQAFKQARETQATQTQEAPEPKTRSKSKRPSSGLTFTEKHELEGIMKLIDEAEAEVARIEAELQQPELYSSRGSEVKGLQAAAAAARAVLEERIARWEHLESKREA